MAAVAVAAAALAAVAAATLGGCTAGGGPDAEIARYFPLAPGRQWSYRVETAWDNDTRDRDTLDIRTLGARELGAGVGRAWGRRSGEGVEWWLQADAAGVRRVASKHELQPEPEADAPARFVLKAPLALGTEWRAATVPYLLRRGAEFPPEIRHTHKPVAMTYRIAALGEAVSVAAGRFDGCVRVQGEATIRLFADAVQGFRDMPLSTTEWYCPDVGLVKLERREPTANSQFLRGGTLTMELVGRD